MPIHSYFISDFVEMQRKSFYRLLEQGLIEEFAKRNPITNIKKDLEIFFYAQYYKLTPPQYTAREAILKAKSYSSRLYLPVQLTDKTSEIIKLKWVYIGNLPLMTKRGHFILNGTARVVVNQMIRSPGIYYQTKIYENYANKWSKKTETTYKRHYADIICQRGAWLRIEIDKQKQIWAQLKKGPKIPILWLLIAMGLPEKIIFKSVIDASRLLWNFGPCIIQDFRVNPENGPKSIKKYGNLTGSTNDDNFSALSQTKQVFVHKQRGVNNLSIYNSLSKEKNFAYINKPRTAWSHIYTLFFLKGLRKPKKKTKNVASNSKTKVVKTPLSLEKKTALPSLPSLPSTLFVDTKSVLSSTEKKHSFSSTEKKHSTKKKKTNMSKPKGFFFNKTAILVSGKDTDSANLNKTMGLKQKHNKNSAGSELKKTTSELGRTWIFNKFMNPRTYDLGKQGRLSINKKLGLNVSTFEYTLTAQDLLFATDYLLKVEKGLKKIDDIDHLKNRRVRTSAELIQIQLATGLVRLEKIIRDKMNKISSELSFKLKTTYIIKKGSSKESKETPSVFIPQNLSNLIGLSATPKSTSLYVNSKSAIDSAVNLSNAPKEDGVVSSTEKKQKAIDQKTADGFGQWPNDGGPAGKKKSSLELLKDKTSIKLPSNNADKLTVPAKITSTEKRLTISDLINTKAFNGAVREFFGSSPLSQFMDQINPLSELTHKRRLSSMGPGGVTRDNATLAIRGIHPTHYGRICPVETPEGKNTGLVNSVTTYARVNAHGLIETPFYKVYKAQVQKKTGMFFFSAQQEEKIKLAAADLFVSKIGFLPKSKIPVRIAEDFTKISADTVQFVGVSAVQMISIATSLIPFLEHDDANRALMGSNMQRQAVPLIRPERPLVGTGLEARAVSDSGHVVQAKHSGFISYVSAQKIIVLGTAYL